MALDVGKIIVVEYSATTQTLYCINMQCMLDRNIQGMSKKNRNDRKVVFVTDDVKLAYGFMKGMSEIIANNRVAFGLNEVELSHLTPEELMKELNG